MPPIGTRPPWQPTRRVEFDTPQEAMNAAVLLFAFGIDVIVAPSHRTAPVEHDVWTVEVRT